MGLQYKHHSMIATNILRVQISESPCYLYDSTSSQTLSEQDSWEVKLFIEGLDNNIIYQHPSVFVNSKLTQTDFFVILSRGATTQINLQYRGQVPKERVLTQVCEKLLLAFNFLYCKHINAAFNPFEDKDGVMPGVSLEPVNSDNSTCIAILPVNLILEPATEISNSKMLLDYSKGKFYQRSEIVRVDKNKHQIVFRNGEVLDSGCLKKAKLKNVTGYALAERLSNYVARINENSKLFLENWGLRLDSRFLQKQSQMIKSGNTSFRGGAQKQLNELIFPMALNTYNHYFRLTYNDVAFEEVLQADITVFIPSSIGKPGKMVAKDLEKVAERMQLGSRVSKVQFESFSKREELVSLLDSYCRKPEPVYVFMTLPELSKAEQDNVDFLKQELIKRAFNFHFFNFDPAKEVDQTDIVAVRQLAVIYAKLRLNPWRLKQIPFGERPTMACNIHVQQTYDDKLSVAVVSSMNALFSKFCCFHSTCTHEALHETIFQLIKCSLIKFESAHRVIPFRVFVYRAGRSLNLPEEFQSVRHRLGQFNTEVRNKNLFTITYVGLNKSHPFRTCTQTNDSYVTSQTVKKTQLLTALEISGKNYLQLEFDEPPIELNIMERQNDPSFVPKLLELTAKLSFGSVGNSFGKGTGFLEYASKLNSYRNFELSSWENLLKEGVMLFL